MGRKPDISDALKTGLGPFYSWRGMIWLAVCVMLVGYSADHIGFALKHTPRDITAADAASCAHNEYVRLKTTLDYPQGLQFKTLSLREYLLVPVSDTGGKLVVYLEGPLSDDELRAIQDGPFVGRLIGSQLGEWDVDAHRIKLTENFQRARRPVSPDTLILQVGYEPHLEPWPVFVGIAATFCLWWFAIRLARTTRLLLRGEPETREPRGDAE